MPHKDVTRNELAGELYESSPAYLDDSTVAAQLPSLKNTRGAVNRQKDSTTTHGDVALDESSYDTEILVLPGPLGPHVRLLRLVEYLNQDLYRTWFKRAVDVVVGTILLALFSPVIGLSWLAVRLTSRGPGFFPQERIGLDGQKIRMWKLRTMYVKHDKRLGRDKLKAIEHGETNGVLHKINDDPRVTLVGEILRTTSLDELPQLWNVICGTMSLVGPRPLLPFMLEPFPEIAESRCQVRPGITGLWQVSAREDNKSVLGMASHDQEYVDNYSLLLDLRILLKTPLVVLSTRGAQ